MEHIRNYFQRIYIYQSERFPLLKHGILILAFSISGVLLTAMLSGVYTISDLRLLVAAFVISLTLFMQLRIADEHKDFDEDMRYRPYRPVQRGLVTLSELRVIGYFTATIQFVLTLIIDYRLILPLILIWIYLGLMSVEFFVRTWIKKHPIFYMVSHMMIIPVVDIFISACWWIPNNNGYIPRGLELFVLISFTNGAILEIGRKIRKKSDEEFGVETYSVLWGAKRALLILLSLMTLVIFMLILLGTITGFYLIYTSTVLVFLTTIFFSMKFLNKSSDLSGKIFETLTGIWTILVYLSIGIIPFCIGGLLK